VIKGCNTTTPSPKFTILVNLPGKMQVIGQGNCVSATLGSCYNTSQRSEKLGSSPDKWLAELHCGPYLPLRAAGISKKTI